MKKNNRMIRAAIAVMIASTTLWLAACQKDKNPATPGTGSNTEMPAKSNNSYVFPEQAHMYGKSLADWGVSFFEWQFSFDTLHSPYLDATGALQNQNQSGNVMFLGGAPTGATNRSVTVPAGKSLLVPLIYYFENTACGETADQVLPGVTGTVPFIGQLMLTIDGNTITDINNYLSITKLFTYASNPGWGEGTNTCPKGFGLDGTSQQVAMGGYWVMLKPLSPGTHTIHTEGGVPVAHFFKQVTWTITQQ